MKRFFLIAALGWVGLHLPSLATAQAPGDLTARDILRVLESSLDMKDFQNPMTLKEVLGLLYEHTANSGLLGRKDSGLPVLVNQQAFKDLNPEAGDIYESPIKFPPYPKKMPVAMALQIALSQVQHPAEATYVIKRGAIELLPAERATMAKLIQQRVIGHFDGKFLSTAVEELAEQTGVSIHVDKRLLDKANVQVTGTFRNHVSLRDALIVLTESAGVKMVQLPTAIFVTTPENAAALREELARPKSAPAAPQPAKPLNK